MNQNKVQCFTEDEMGIARNTNMPELLSSLVHTEKRIGSYYTTSEMDSLRIKAPMKWYRFSTGQHGDAITFLQEFCGMRFPEAVNCLLAYHGRARDSSAPLRTQTCPKPAPPKEPRAFALPPAHSDQRRIDTQIIRDFIDAGLLYRDTPHHNSVFIGRDASGPPKSANKRGT